MYATQLQNSKVTLGVSGKLWHRSLVMYDRETGSLWSHILGEAMSGELEGTRLAQVPSVLTDWRSWSAAHPTGTVVMLSRTAEDYTTKMYRRADRFVLAISAGVRAKAWTFTTLEKQPVRHELWLNQPVVILFDRPSRTPRMYRRILDDRQLTFKRVSSPEGGRDVVQDRETGSTWDPITGVATAGRLRGRHLQAMPAIVSFKRAWMAFHPDSQLH